MTDREFFVEISPEVTNRIRKALTNSSVEEGGKLLGNITESSEGIRIQVLSYLDSGPNVDSSPTHLHPDGLYQEALFRVVESFDPKIEHIGSWHSHHCNGLPELSNGDISGYLSSVNDHNYNIDYFLVYLIVAESARRLSGRFFVFERGEKGFVEVDSSRVTALASPYKFEGLLREAEKCSRDRRNNAERIPIHGTEHDSPRPLSRHSEPHALGSLANTESSAPSVMPESVEPATGSIQPDFLKQVRKEDNQWLPQVFPDARPHQKVISRQITWKWRVIVASQEWTIQYRYPKIAPIAGDATAELVASCQGREIASASVSLDESRQQTIEDFVTQIGQLDVT